MFKESPEYRYFKAYQAWKHAKNPEWQAFWLRTMKHFSKEFIN